MRNLKLPLAITMLLASFAHAENIDNLPKSFILLAGDYSEGQYDEYKVYLDKNSVKKLPDNKALFNMIVFGLDIDRETLYDTAIVGDPDENKQNMDNNRLIITNEIDCKSSKIVPIKYLTLDAATQQTAVVAPNDDDVALPTSDADKAIVQKIKELSCS